MRASPTKAASLVAVLVCVNAAVFVLCVPARHHVLAVGLLLLLPLNLAYAESDTTPGCISLRPVVPNLHSSPLPHSITLNARPTPDERPAALLGSSLASARVRFDSARE
ncbi:unnamed protein product [Diplocarpon coronariae]